MTLKVSQSAVQIDAEAPLWDWSVWLEGPDADLNQVEYVTWKLHPTFAEPIVRIHDRGSGFRLDRSGWGAFEIRADIHFLKDRPRLSLRHMLRFDRDTDESGQEDRVGEGSAETLGSSVYLACKLPDTALVHAVADGLAEIGLKVTRDVDVPAGRDFGEWLRKTITDSNLLVILGAQEAWGANDIEARAALAASVPIAVIDFSGMGLSKLLRKTPSPIFIQRRSGNPATIADRIGEMAIAKPTPGEGATVLIAGRWGETFESALVDSITRRDVKVLRGEQRGRNSVEPLAQHLALVAVAIDDGMDLSDPKITAVLEKTSPVPVALFTSGGFTGMFTVPPEARVAFIPMNQTKPGRDSTEVVASTVVDRVVKSGLTRPKIAVRET